MFNGSPSAGSNDRLPDQRWLPSTHEANDMTRTHPLLLSLLLVISCNPPITHSAEDHSVASVIDALKERSTYAKLDQPAVAALARAAKAHWPQELSGFTYRRVERFSAGGVSHWMSIWLHGKTGLEFVLLPGGRFQMGSPEGEANRQEDELQHWVTLDPFLIARTECSQDAWARVAGAAGLNGGSFDGSPQLPVAGIGPVDVELWCREALLTFPTEAQWEYMCRGGTTSAWAMGAKKSDLVRFGNLGSAECPKEWTEMAGITEPWRDGYGNHTAKVGRFACNSFGLFDVHGNLNEWCRDYYFGYEVAVEKGTGVRPGNSGERLARGGNFGGDASAARSAKRLTCGSGIAPGGGGNNGFGFRPSLDLPLCAATASRQRVIDIDPRIWCIYQDRSGNYWFGSNGNGVYRYKDPTITQYTQTDGLIGGQVRDIEEDSDGNVLVSTNGGVSKFDGKRFKALKMVEAPSSDVGWVLDPEDVWIVFDPGNHGICRYDGETLYRLRLPTSPAEDVYRAKHPDSAFSPAAVYSIYKDRRGHLWFGTAGVGLCRYDGQSWSWLYEEPLTTTPSGGAFGIRSVYEDRAGNLWVCNTRQRFKVSRESRIDGKYRLLEYTKKQGLPQAQADTAENFSYFQSMTEDTAGSLWMACGNDGVWKYDGKAVTRYSLGDGAYALSIYRDHGGKLWVGTLQHGIYTFGEEKFEPFMYEK
jgi:formylglycine-generating enzyme required for sulfatase activity